MATNGAPAVSAALTSWVEAMAARTKPARVQWCDGSQAEYDGLVAAMLADGTLHRLDPTRFPGCHLHRSHPTDVARTEGRTFICSADRDGAGPLNNWMAPDEARATIGARFDGCMRGRTMYVVPYLMGPTGSPMSRVGVELTDSAYVAANMRIMTRMGTVALEHLRDGDEFCKGLHSVATLDPEGKYVAHFPQDREIWSINSGYGGNALLGKKCFALRIGSVMGRDQGWLAEHMLILGVTPPGGRTRYVCAAFPSACGKTNLAMLVPPASMAGWKVETVGDDIAWLRYGPDGRLYAINPEAGFFGVAPGTSAHTNPNALATIQRDTIYTNVAVTPDGEPWWEGKTKQPPEKLTDWKGNPWTPAANTPAAHPNSRFTVAARQCPSISPRFEDPAGVPIDAIVFGGRRASGPPLVYESFDWAHGTFVGATMGSEQTAAAEGPVGALRRDPMAMRPFTGYHTADYWAHWLAMGAKSRSAPRIFHVNWFRKGPDGRFLWPGFGENLRVLDWILRRCDGAAPAAETPIGRVPTPEALDLRGCDVTPDALRELLAVRPAEWRADVDEQPAYFAQFGDRLPAAIAEQSRALARRLGA